MDKYLFYVGSGKGSLIGVPARDLSYDEARRFGITTLLASGLYVYNSQHAIPIEYQKDLGILVDIEDEEIKEHQTKNRQADVDKEINKIMNKKRSKKERE